MNETMTLEDMREALGMMPMEWHYSTGAVTMRPNAFVKSVNAAITERDALRAEVERLREIEHDAVRMAWLIVNECGGRVTVKPRDVAAWRSTDILSRYPDMDGSVTFVAKHARPNDPEPPAERGEG